MPSPMCIYKIEHGFIKGQNENERQKYLIELRPAGTGRDSGSREIIYLFMHHSKYLNFTI